MIRINLLDDIKVTHTHSAIEGIKAISIDGKQLANFIVKIGFILLPSLAIYGWNYTEKTSKEVILNALKVREKEVVSKIEQEHQKYNEIKKLQQEALKLDKTIESLSQTARKRTIILEALNLLHDIVPDQAWLTEVELHKDNKIIFMGEAKPSAINVFAANLETKKEVYENVNISPDENLENPRTDYAKFKISAELVLDQDQAEESEVLENQKTPESPQDNTKEDEKAAAQTKSVINQDEETSINKK